MLEDNVEIQEAKSRPWETLYNKWPSFFNKNIGSREGKSRRWRRTRGGEERKGRMGRKIVGEGRLERRKKGQGRRRFKTERKGEESCRLKEAEETSVNCKPQAIIIWNSIQSVFWNYERVGIISVLTKYLMILRDYCFKCLWNNNKALLFKCY